MSENDRPFEEAIAKSEERSPELIELEATLANSWSPQQQRSMREQLLRITRLVSAHYTDVTLIGSGGMSQVYRATHKLLRHQVAIKVLNVSDLVDESHAKRLRAEAMAIKELTHPNIVSMREFNVAEETAYLVMDYVDGAPLSTLIASGARMSDSAFCHTFEQVCQALEHAHTHGVIHRDIKPSNIMIARAGDPRERVKLVDFGIAKVDGATGTAGLTQTGDILGTPLYMSPEQSMGRSLDQRSDIYALGCIMYECIAGRPPIVGENILQIVHSRINQEPPSFKQLGVECSPALEAIVRKSLAIDPGARFQNAAELRTALADPSGFVLATAAPKGKVPNKLVMAALLALSVAVATGALWVHNRLDSANKSTKTATTADSSMLSGKQPDNALTIVSQINTAKKLIEQGDRQSAYTIIKPLAVERENTMRALGQLGPQYFPLILQLYGRTLSRLDKEYDTAKDCFEQALKMQAESNSPPRDIAKTHMYLADLLIRDRNLGEPGNAIPGDYSAAIREYEKALQLVDRDPSPIPPEPPLELEIAICSKLAHAFDSVVNKPAQAEPYYKRVAKLQFNLMPWDAAKSLETLGVFYDNHGQKSKAEAAFKTAAQLRHYGKSRPVTFPF